MYNRSNLLCYRSPNRRSKSHTSKNVAKIVVRAEGRRNIGILLEYLGYISTDPRSVEVKIVVDREASSQFSIPQICIH